MQNALKIDLQGKLGANMRCAEIASTLDHIKIVGSR